MQNLEKNIIAVKKSIQQNVISFGRDESEVSLLAVSKRHSHTAIREAYGYSQRHFGENYATELAEKAAHLQDLDIQWHFIGPIQSNKTIIIAKHCHWVHSVDRYKIAQRLNDQRDPELGPLKVLIQVNIDKSPSKSGCQPCELFDLAETIHTMPQLALRGLMCLPAPEQSSNAFQSLATLKGSLEKHLATELTDLSMGMTGDLKPAIEAGSTWVRVGTGIFGPRH